MIFQILKKIVSGEKAIILMIGKIGQINIKVMRIYFYMKKSIKILFN